MLPPLSQTDAEMFAARIRAHFEPELQTIAYDLALNLARSVGSKVEELRPETTLQEIFGWFDVNDIGHDSLDRVEWQMALEEDLEFEIPDALARDPAAGTFRDLVRLRARRRAA